MDLPESLKAYIGEFVLNFPKLTKSEQNSLKKKLAQVIASSYEEYSEFFFKDYKIPFFKDFKSIYLNVVSALQKNAEDIINRYKPGEYRDIIMENFALSISKILNVVEFCYSQTKDLNKACEIYCQLGYTGYGYRHGNENYLINFINQWVDFYKEKGGNVIDAQYGLLYNFIAKDFDDEFIVYDVRKQKELCSFFPYKVANVDDLVDYVLKHDTFHSPLDYCTSKDEEVREDDKLDNAIIKPITPNAICQFIIENDTPENALSKHFSMIHYLAIDLGISKYSSKEALDNAIRRIAGYLEYVSTELDTSDYSSINTNDIFCVKLVPTELSSIYVVRLEDDIYNVLYYLFINRDKAPTKLKLNSFVSLAVSSETGKLELHDAGNKYRFGYGSLDSLPYQAILSNYYVYIFNKANDKTPFSLFTVCAYAKWLLINYDLIGRFIPELSESELHSLLLDYAIKTCDSLNPIPVCYDCITSVEEEDVNLIVNLMYDIKEHRSMSKYELVDFWKYIVLESDLLFVNGTTIGNPHYLNVIEVEYPENGKFFLPWKYVRYVEGKAFFYHPNHEKGTGAIFPFIHKSDTTEQAFSELSKNILWNFPPIECKCDNGKIIKIDDNYANYVISNLKFIYHEFERRKKTYRISNSMTAKDILLKYKSIQLLFLEKKQLKELQIIPIGEKFYSSSTHSYREEPSLLFSIGKSGDTMTLIYENVSISRASYIFIIKSNCYEDAISRITNYFTSDTPNKRSDLQFSRDMFSLSDGIVRVIRVVHDDNDKWQSAINFYAKQV